MLSDGQAKPVHLGAITSPNGVFARKGVLDTEGATPVVVADGRTGGAKLSSVFASTAGAVSDPAPRGWAMAGAICVSAAATTRSVNLAQGAQGRPDGTVVAIAVETAEVSSVFTLSCGTVS